MRAYRNACGLLIAAAIAAPGCGSPHTPPIDLIRELPHADRRAAGSIDQNVRIDVITVGSETMPALVTVSPARVTYPVHLVDTHMTLRGSIALLPDAAGAPIGVTARIGIADDRFYEDVAKIPLRSPGAGSSPLWQPINIDLSKYSGWRFSLFYQPYRHAWRLILAADAAPRGTLAWGNLLIARRE